MKKIICCIFVWAWIFPLAFGLSYDFPDAVYDLMPDGDGKEASIAFISLLHKVTSNIECDPEADKFLEFWYQSVKHFDFTKLYSSPYLSELDNDYRGVQFQGRNQIDAYVISLLSEKNNNQKLNRLGDFIAKFGLKKNKKSTVTDQRSFSGYLDLKAALKQLSHRTLLSFFEGNLHVIDPENIKQLNPPESDRYNSIQGDSRPIIDAFNQSFSKFFEYCERYISLKQLIDIDTFEGTQFTKFIFRFNIDYKGLSKDFPYLAAHMKKIRGLFRADITCRKKNGNRLLYVIVDSNDDSLYCEFYTKEGKIIPIDENNNPVFEEAFLFSKLKYYDFIVDTNLFFNVFGLKMKTDHILVDVKYYNDPLKGGFHIMMKDLEKTKVYGRAYHIFPTWFIDFMIPSNIDHLIYLFSQTMLKANEGEGSYITFEWDTSNSNNITLSHHASSEFIDNFFILFGFRVWNDKFSMDEQTWTELNLVLNQGISELLEDLAALPRIKPNQTKPNQMKPNQTKPFSLLNN